jgi:rubrerythrin
VPLYANILLKIIHGGVTMKSLENILRYAYAAEVNGEKLYEENALNMKNEGARVVFEKLVAMEEEHKRYIREFANKIGITLEVEDQGSKEHFEKRFNEVTPKSSLSSDLGDLAILRVAYLIEHDLADFYRRAASKTENADAKKLLEELAGWEEEHERMIREEYNEIQERNWGEAEYFPF